MTVNIYTTIYNDNRLAIIRLDNGDVRIDTRPLVFGTIDIDQDAPINSVTIPNTVARHIDFTDIDIGNITND
tara:strand:- start:244 stop:459 length:216 start_codon:yes stop_codon:yes gene_type:complete